MKKIMTVLAVGALVLSMAGIGSAATVEVNIYGASAALNFWAAMATNYLQSAAPAGPAACASVNANGTGWSPSGTAYHGAKYFIAEGVGPCASWTGVGSGDVFRIRVAAYDSSDGIQAVAGTGNNIDYKGCTGKQRTQLNTYAGGNADSNLTCVDTHLGASDVNGATIVQTTEGQLDGPQGPSTTTIIKGVDLSDFVAPANFVTLFQAGQGVHTCTNSNLNLIDHHPWVVPFGFFVSSDQKTVGDGKLGPYVTNLTQGMIEQIFSRTVKDWSTFYPALGSTPIALCLRVAGSGTYATFDAGVMKTNKNTLGLPTIDTPNGGLSNTVWFNNSSADMQYCINNTPGAIGFMDADQGLGSLPHVTGPISFNGAAPTSANIANGLYDRFWSLEHIFEPNSTLKGNYTNPAYPSDAVSGSNGIVTWAATQNPKPATWVLSGNMKVYKANDFTFPPQLGSYGSGCYE